MLVSGDRLADAHHDVDTHATAQLILELCVMTFCGVTSNRLFTIKSTLMAYKCDVRSAVADSRISKSCLFIVVDIADQYFAYVFFF